MPRPYLSYSIDKLEGLVGPGNAEPKILAAIEHELTFRRTPRARELAEEIKKLKAIEPPPARTDTNPTAKLPAGPTRTPRKITSSQHPPTAQQVEAVDAFGRGGSLKINAYAGTGKTSTLQLLANSTTRRGQYIAFNKSIVEDAKSKFPQTVNCSTLHGMAFRATSSEYRKQGDKMTGTCNANQLAELLGVTKNWRVDQHHTLPPRSQGYLILETVKRFAQSADSEPSAAHVPRHGSLAAATDTTLREVEAFAVKGARHVWSRMISAEDPLPLGHDGYLKLWALSSPRIAADYILLDEAQDTNPVVLEALRAQEAQMVYVGDRYQQIYEWRGAVNAMEKIETASTTLLTQSFRFGGAIADAASRVLSTLGEPVAVTGNPKIVSRICFTAPNTILARTNASAISAVISALDGKQRPHLVGGIKDLMELLNGVAELKQGMPTTVAEFFGFSDWNSVVAFAKSGEGGHLLTFVNLVESRGERQLMWALKNTVEESGADVVVSTAHKAKGREWARVRLMDDFLRNTPGKKPELNCAGGAAKPDPAEIRLLYVAMTRAREELEMPPPLAVQFNIHCSESSQPLRQVDPRHSVAPRLPAGPKPAPWNQPRDWQEKPKAVVPPAPPTPRPSPAPANPKKSGIFDWLFG